MRSKIFIVFDEHPDNRLFSASTTQEIYYWLQTQDSLNFGSWMIMDIDDDIEVDVDDFIRSYEDAGDPINLDKF